MFVRFKYSIIFITVTITFLLLSDLGICVKICVFIDIFFRINSFPVLHPVGLPRFSFVIIGSTSIDIILI